MWLKCRYFSYYCYFCAKHDPMKTNNFIKIPLIICLLISYFSVSSQNYGSMTYSDAINMSGKQRMLSQKISKVYMMRLNGTPKEATDEEFKASTRLFNKNLISLDDNSKNSSDKTKGLIAEEKLQWEKFLSKFLLNPTDNVSKLLVLSNGLLDKCKAVVTGIENDGSSASGDAHKLKTINTSGKQRMLSQRLSLYYLASKLNAGKPQLASTQGELKRIYAEMQKSFASLSANSLNNDEINKNFEILKNEFSLITGNMSGFENQSIDADKILSFSNKVTSTYNTITGIYAKL